MPKARPAQTAREIAVLQQQLADLLDEAGRRAEELEIALARKGDELIAGLAANRHGVADAAAASAP